MVEVGKRKAETDILIAKVGEESAAAQVEQDAATVEEKATNQAADNANRAKQIAEKELSEALPALEAAKEAVNCLKKNHIGEMKGLGTPPPLVQLTAKVTLTLLGEKINMNEDLDKVWKKACSIMNNPAKFLDQILAFNAEAIDDSVLVNVKKLMEDPGYTSEKMKTQNYAAMILCTWSINIVKFNSIFKMVKPLVESKNAAQEELDTKNKQLAIVLEKVRLLNEKVTALKSQLCEAESEKQAVEDDAAQCEAKLAAAIKLVNGLSGENKRWKILVKEL